MQETEISELKTQAKDQAVCVNKLTAEKNKLETEIKQTSKGYLVLQTELTLAQQKLKDFESEKQLCQSEKCRQSTKDLDAQLQRRTKEIYDLTVQLGCIETENRELKTQLEDKSYLYESRVDSTRLLLEQEL